MPIELSSLCIEEKDDFSTVFRVGIPDSANQKITTFAREELEKELELLVINLTLLIIENGFTFCKRY